MTPKVESIIEYSPKETMQQYFVTAYQVLYLVMMTSIRPVAQIPQCIRPIYHNAPFCEGNVHMCAHFCYKMVHCGLSYRQLPVAISGENVIKMTFPFQSSSASAIPWMDEVAPISNKNITKHYKVCNVLPLKGPVLHSFDVVGVVTWTSCWTNDRVAGDMKRCEAKTKTNKVRTLSIATGVRQM